MRKTISGLTILLLASTGFCAELWVPGQYATIQSAIDAAVDGDIVVVEPGLYEGPNNTNLAINSKAITVRSVDPNNHWAVSSTIIDCDGSGRGFNLNANAAVEGLTITDGSISNGGAINVQSSCSPVIRNCVISDNSSTSYGGGIYSAGSPTIIGCKVTGNNAVTQAGGIYCAGSSKTVTIIDCEINDNTAGSYGGGIYSVISSGTLNINRSSISGNVTSSSGGGIYVSQGTVYINNSIVAGNFSQNNGGGVNAPNSPAYMSAEGCTFADNTAVGLGGGASGRFDGILNIFWGNSDTGGAGSPTAQINAPANWTGLQFSCIQDIDPDDTTIPFGGADKGNIDDDPMFVDSANGDYHLQKDSPCIEAGNPLSIPDPNATDIDGQPRVAGLVEDMGADEYGLITVVTSPVEGEVWATGSRHLIQWAGSVANVDITLSTDNGATWDAIAEDLTDANSYLWDVPDYVDSNQCLISVVAGDGDPNVISIESGLFTVSWYPSQPDVPPDMLRRGKLAAPTLSENQGPQLGCIKWVFDTNGPVSSQVAVTWPYWNSYGVYIGCEDGQIYALDDLGELMWSYDINTPIVGSPAVGYYGMAYVAGQNGWLYAIDEYGYLRWTHISDGPIYSTPVVGYDGKIYLCSQDGAIYALGGNGSALWTFKTSGPAKLSSPILATPVIDKNKTVYVAGLYDPNLYALDANNGSVKWACNFDPCDSNNGQLFASPAIGPDGTIYQTLIGDPNLYALDPCTGNILWKTQLRPDPCYSCDLYSWQCCRTFDRYLTAVRNHTTITYSDYDDYLNDCNEGKWQGISVQGWMYSLNSSGWSSPVVGSDGTIYVSFDDPYLRAVEPNGTIKWITRLGTVGGFTLSIDRDNLIYAASDDNFVCIVEPNGKELSRFEGNEWVCFPTIAEDGTLFVSDANNRVWAISNQDCYFQPAALHRPQDVDSGWAVNFMDFAVMANNWLDCTDQYNSPLCQAGIDKYGLYSPADVDRDQYVDTWDLAEMVDKWLLETSDSQSWSQKDWQDWPHTHGPAVTGGPQF